MQAQTRLVESLVSILCVFGIFTGGCDGSGTTVPAANEPDAGFGISTLAGPTVGRHGLIPLSAARRRSSLIGPRVLWRGAGGEIIESDYEVLDDDGQEVLVEGDIALGDVNTVWGEQGELRRERDAFRSGDKSHVSTHPWRQWRTRTIRWRFHEGPRHELSSSVKDRVRAAVAAWNAVAGESGLTLEYDSGLNRTQSGILVGYSRENRCYARTVGRRSGVTKVFLGDDCKETHIIQHELGHALGLFHEHSRSDVDDGMRIELDVVTDEDVDQYTEDRQRRLVGFPDASSLMVYYPYG